MARFAPASASKVRLDQFLAGLRQHLHGDVVRDRFLLDDRRGTKSKSVCDGGGKADLDLLVAELHQQHRTCVILRSASIGSISDWLPSRRSTEHQTGGAVIVRSGQVRSFRPTIGKGRYFAAGFGMLMTGSSNECGLALRSFQDREVKRVMGVS
jgi:hypothetical protein